MHSPRIRVPAQSSKATMYKSWIGAKPPKSSTSKPLQDEIEKFKILLRQCEEENRNLLSTLTAFNAINEIDSQTFLIDQFENELNQISKRIDKRSILIDSIEKKSSRRKEAEFKNQDIYAEKTQLIAENAQLVNKALFLEKKMLAAKLKLRLSHDHRDFCRLKRQLSRLADNDESANEEEMEIYRNKEIIRNLKNAIEHEKTRLLRINAPPTLEEEAAEIIQKVWRGYKTRKALGQANQGDANNKCNNSLKGNDATFPELDNSDLANDQYVEESQIVNDEISYNQENNDIQGNNENDIQEGNFDDIQENNENNIQEENEIDIQGNNENDIPESIENDNQENNENSLQGNNENEIPESNENDNQESNENCIQESNEEADNQINNEENSENADQS